MGISLRPHLRGKKHGLKSLATTSSPLTTATNVSNQISQSTNNVSTKGQTEASSNAILFNNSTCSISDHHLSNMTEPCFQSTMKEEAESNSQNMIQGSSTYENRSNEAPLTRKLASTSPFAASSTCNMTASAFTRKWLYDHRLPCSSHPDGDSMDMMKSEGLWIESSDSELALNSKTISSSSTCMSPSDSETNQISVTTFSKPLNSSADTFNKPNRKVVHSYNKDATSTTIAQSAAGTYEQLKIRAHRTEIDRFFAELQSLLNKLTMERFELAERIKEKFTEIDNLDTLITAIKIVHRKASSERKYARMYSELCKKLEEMTPVILSTTSLSDSTVTTKKNKSKTFMRIMLNQLQLGFEEKVGMPPLTGAEDEELFYKNRDRLMGNMAFMGELYTHGLLAQSLVQRCISSLVQSIQSAINAYLLQAPNQPSIEPAALAEIETECEKLVVLVGVVGRVLDANGKDVMDKLIEDLKDLAASSVLSLRVRFLIRDVIDNHNNKWQPRYRPEAPMTIDAIHELIGAEQLNPMPSILDGPRKVIPTSEYEKRACKINAAAVAASDRNIDSNSNHIGTTNKTPSTIYKKDKNANSNGSSGGFTNSLKGSNLKARNIIKGPSTSNATAIASETKEERIKILNSLLDEHTKRLDGDKIKDFLRERKILAHEIVTQIIMHTVQYSTTGQTLVFSLLLALIKENLITVKCLVQGFCNATANLNELTIDTPDATTCIAEMVGKTVKNGIISTSSFEKIERSCPNNLRAHFKQYAII